MRFVFISRVSCSRFVDAVILNFRGLVVNEEGGNKRVLLNFHVYGEPKVDRDGWSGLQLKDETVAIGNNRVVSVVIGPFSAGL